jgi:hypothetical protein
LPGEEPVGAPLPEPAERREPCLHIVVGERLELVEIEVGARDAKHVLGFAQGEAESGQLLFLRARDAFAGREGNRMLGGDAEAVDEAAAHSERGVQRHLLRGDRRHERLERVRCERRPKPGHQPHGVGEHRIALRELEKRRQVELEPEQLAHHALDRGVQRLDVDAAVGRGDSNLTPSHDTVQAALVPDVRAVDSPEREAVERALEVIRLRDSQVTHRPKLPSYKNGSRTCNYEFV